MPGKIGRQMGKMKHMVSLHLFRSGQMRGKYLRKQKLFRHMGKGVDYMPKELPSHPDLISIGNNVLIAPGVRFLTDRSLKDSGHETLYQKIRRKLQSKPLELAGCIKIDDGVLIGTNSRIGRNVRVGRNVIILAHSVVTEDILPGSVVRGNPAKVICKAENYYRVHPRRDPGSGAARRRSLAEAEAEFVEWMWKKFEDEHITME